jgi:DNA repair protein SbcD/Mre11
MRVLHTGDWHVGRTLSRVSRLDETREVLAEVVDIAARESVDAVVVCGDVFEHLSPSAEAEQVVYEALEALSRHAIPVVLLAGNHDHPGRWHALGPLFRRFHIHVVDDLRTADDGGIIELSSRDGKQALQVAAVPWVSERRMFKSHDMMGGGELTYQSYADGMSKAMHTLCDCLDPQKCTMLAAHIFISGTQASGSERELGISDLYAVTPNAIPTTVQYAALGHVHKPQKGVGVSIPCRYAGSLLQVDFGERGQQKSVMIVDLEPGKPAQIREVPLQSGRKLREITGTLDDLERYRHEGDTSYLKVTLLCDGPQPGLSDQVRELLPNALIVKLEYPDLPDQEAADVRLEPRQLFEAYLMGRYASPPSPELLDLFESLLAEVVPA